MKYFSYSEYLDPTLGYLVGPAKFLPEGSAMGYYNNGIYYGYADIPSLDAIALFNPLEITEGDFYRAIGDNYKGLIADGFTLNGVTYDISDEALNRFTQTLVLLREGNVPDAAQFAIADKSGTLHSMTVGEVRSTLVSLGMFWNQKWAEFKTTASGSI